MAKAIKGETFGAQASGRLSRRAIFAMLALAPLAACGGAPPETFNLTAATFPAGARRARGQLAVEIPTAIAPINSDRLAVRPTPDTIATLKGAQWAENLPGLVQARLIDSFENSHLLLAAGKAGASFEATHTLISDIRQFTIDVAANEAVVEISTKLATAGSGRVVASKVFTAREPASANDSARAAMALDAALGKILRDMTAWTAAHI